MLIKLCLFYRAFEKLPTGISLFRGKLTQLSPTCHYYYILELEKWGRRHYKLLKQLHIGKGSYIMCHKDA